MTSFFGGGSSTPAAPTPPPPPVVQTPDATTTETIKARKRAQNEAALASKRGRASTILTGEEGAGNALTGTKTLLGR